ncbi:unnamed protein product, partial [Rotaria sordida]
MLNVVLDIPRSLTTNKDITEACYQLEEEEDIKERIELKPSDIDDFKENYTSDNALTWYTRDSFLFRVLNKACRMLNNGTIISFHSIIKDLTIQLKQLYKQQIDDGTLNFPLIVYRGQPKLDIGELEKIRANVGGLISMNTFLSTTTYCPTATTFISGADRSTCVLFQITVKNPKDLGKFQTFAHINEYSNFQGEKEILFGMSSVCRVISVEEEDCFWYVNLELTDFENDKHIQKLMNELRSYLYQISGQQAPFYLLKQFFTTSSLSQVKPFTEFLKYFLIDASPLFVANAYNKEGKMKTLIDMDPNLYALTMKTSTAVVHSNEMSIHLVFDLLNNFLYSNDKNIDEQVIFDKNDTASLLCFGGFLLFTGDYDKAIQYFKMLLEHELINDNTKAHIHVLLGSSYIMKKERELALKSFDKAFQSCMPQSIPPWLAASIASLHSTLHDHYQSTNQTLQELQLLMKNQQSDNDDFEKLRLLHLGNVCSEQQKFIDALNYWEEAVEITSYMPSSLVTILKGAIYVQMAAAYFRINNISKALNVMKTAMQYFECYYPSTHRMFASFHFLCGYYLIHNEKPSEAVVYLNKALENSYFSQDKEFLGNVYALLVMGYIQSDNFDLAVEYCDKAEPYISPNNISAAIPQLAAEIPEIKMITTYQDPNHARQVVRTGLLLGKLLLSVNVPNPTTQPQSIDEFIAIADHHRHCQDDVRAQIFYTTALDKTTEIDSKHLWNIYRKMRRMDENDSYKDYFTALYSKYDDENPKHFEIISTIQIIL